jgi:hypothetical protein
MTGTSPAVDDRATDWAILVLLLDPGDRLPWSIDEICREIGDRLAANESLGRLYRVGLIYRCNEFVFPTRPARRFEELRS